RVSNCWIPVLVLRQLARGVMVPALPFVDVRRAARHYSRHRTGLPGSCRLRLASAPYLRPPGDSWLCGAMKSALIIRHVPVEGIAGFREAVEQAGYRIDRIDVTDPQFGSLDLS